MTPNLPKIPCEWPVRLMGLSSLWPHASCLYASHARFIIYMECVLSTPLTILSIGQIANGDNNLLLERCLAA